MISTSLSSLPTSLMVAVAGLTEIEVDEKDREGTLCPDDCKIVLKYLLLLLLLLYRVLVLVPLVLDSLTSSSSSGWES